METLAATSDLDQMPSRSDLIVSLHKMREEQDELLGELLSDPSRVSASRHLVVAALRRSDALMDGFMTLLDHGNRFCAVPLTRLQLDSALRVFACSLVDDVSSFVLHLLNGGQPSKFKDRDGCQMVDKYLHEKLSNKFPQLSELYQDTSGYVHLSNKHLFGVLDIPQTSEGNGIVYANPTVPMSWADPDKDGALIEFLCATMAVLDESKCLLKLESEGSCQ